MVGEQERKRRRVGGKEEKMGERGGGGCRVLDIYTLPRPHSLVGLIKVEVVAAGLLGRRYKLV